MISPPAVPGARSRGTPLRRKHARRANWQDITLAVGTLACLAGLACCVIPLPAAAAPWLAATVSLPVLAAGAWHGLGLRELAARRASRGKGRHRRSPGPDSPPPRAAAAASGGRDRGASPVRPGLRRGRPVTGNPWTDTFTAVAYIAVPAAGVIALAVIGARAALRVARKR